ncbi:hypothetical protein Leryth_018263 [Lithospermum erythrorhizon]|nr:hypothetical protein Leryth_018263 [Lithospermum erythrorhizon]
MLRISGLGEETHLPPSLHYIPPGSSHKDAIEEAHIGFCPIPSLSDIIINKFSLREDVKCFNCKWNGILQVDRA